MRQFPKSAARLLAASALLIGVAGCGGSDSDDATGDATQSMQPGGSEPVNVLLVTLDTTRRDYLGCYGGGDGVTPNLDSLAADGVRFDRAISTSAATPISHASILTGLNNYQHGVRVIYAEDGFRLADSVQTVTTMLHERGWSTGAFLSSFTVSSFFGFQRGFDVFDEGLGIPADESFNVESNGFWDWPLAQNQRRSDETTDRIVSWLWRTEPPFFAWLHYWDPHDRVVLPPEEFREPFVTPDLSRMDHLRETYQTEIRYVDEQFGDVIDVLRKRGWYDNTLIIVVADHGEGLGDHGWWGHQILYQEQINVPLIVRAPGWPRGRSVDDLVRTVDIAPTITDLVGVRTPPDLAGKSLTPLVEGRKEAPRVAYADAINAYDLNAIIVESRPDDGLLHCAMDRDWKLIHRPLLDGADELYHLATDPNETTNVIADAPEQAARLKRELDRFDGYVESPFGDELDPKVLERLKSLGYVGN